MPFQRVIYTAETDKDAELETQAALAKKLEGVLAKVDLLSVRRYPKNSGKAKVIGLPIKVSFDEVTEDASTLCREIAADAIAMAMEDAGDKRAKFQFVALAEAAPGGTAHGMLFELDGWVNADDDRPSTRQAEEVGMLRVAKDHMAGVSSEHVKLLAKTNELVGMVVTVLGKMTDSNGERWKSDVEVAKMKIEHDLRGAEILTRSANAQSRHKMYVDLINRVAPIAERVVDAMTGKVRDEDEPTPEEVDKIFGTIAPDLRDLGLAVLRAKKGADRNGAVSKLRAAWDAAGQGVQADAVKTAHAKLGEDRAKRVVMWIAAMFNSNTGGA